MSPVTSQLMGNIAAEPITRDARKGAGGPAEDFGRMTHRSVVGRLMQPQQAPAQVGKPGEQCLVIDIGDQWMHDGAADRAREHGRLDPPVQPRVAEQHPIEALHETLERFVFGQQSNHDRIELQRPHQPAVANRHLDHAYQQRVAGLWPVAVRLGFLERRCQPAEFALSDGEHDLFLGPELVIDGGFRDPDGVSDHLQRGAADAVHGEQVQRGIEYAGPGGAVPDERQLPVGCCFHTTRLDERLLTHASRSASFGDRVGVGRRSCVPEGVIVSDIGEGDVEARPGTPRRTDGELILLWTLPAAAAIWLSAFVLFPGFTPPMSPTMPAEQVAAFYRDPVNLPRIRYSMILFNWFCVCLIPILILMVMQIRRMAHRTPIFSYCMLGCVAGGPTLFLIANVCWLVAAFRPERSPQLTQTLNDFAWITFTTLVPFLIAQSVILALAIYFDDQPRPVLNRWVAHFNLLVAAALVPAAFVGLALTGPLAWDGTLSFWLKNIAIGVWIVVMGVVLGQAIYRERAAHPRDVQEHVAA
jgi:hypothetical protein